MICYGTSKWFSDYYWRGRRKLIRRRKTTYFYCALYSKNAPIIILDEATASIDSDNESYIQEAIDALVNGKILLVIAHRLNTIKNANQILVLDEGKITEHGTHEELIIQDGLYRCLWSSQQNTGTWKIN